MREIFSIAKRGKRLLFRFSFTWLLIRLCCILGIFCIKKVITLKPQSPTCVVSSMFQAQLVETKPGQFQVRQTSCSSQAKWRNVDERAWSVCSKLSRRFYDVRLKHTKVNLRSKKHFGFDENIFVYNFLLKMFFNIFINKLTQKGKFAQRFI